MKVFVVLSNLMGGVQSSGVYRDSAMAGQRAAQNIGGKNPRVVDFDVEGTQTDPNIVYVAQTYDPTMDVHNFEGVYGNYEDASRASGARGQALAQHL